MTRPLAVRLEVLRDEVLETARHGTENPPGAEVWDAILRRVAAGEGDDTELDLSLREAIARRLAWGEAEADILASASGVATRLIVASDRALGHRERLFVAEVVAEIGALAARAVALAALGRAGRERAELLREERLVFRLEEARARQQRDIRALEGALAEEEAPE